MESAAPATAKPACRRRIAARISSLVAGKVARRSAMGCQALRARYAKLSSTAFDCSARNVVP
jgi:hypothetical protein